MADASEPEAGSSGTKIEDIRPEDFVLVDFIQEIATLIQERQAFLNSKIERRTIHGPDRNLAEFRLIRMRGLHHYLKRIEAHQAGRAEVESMPAPKIESPLKDFVEEIEAAADETLPLEPPPAAPEQAPAVEYDDWD